VPSEKQVSLVTLVRRDDRALDTCFAGERERSVDVRACSLLLMSATGEFDFWLVGE
jgi:hypothetical protein